MVLGQMFADIEEEEWEENETLVLLPPPPAPPPPPLVIECKDGPVQVCMIMEGIKHGLGIARARAFVILPNFRFIGGEMKCDLNPMHSHSKLQIHTCLSCYLTCRGFLADPMYFSPLPFLTIPVMASSARMDPA